MNLLAIDTSTEHASVALSINGEIGEVRQHVGRQHANLLLIMINELLAGANLTVSQLDAIAFGRGPGSFTGIRIACSVAKGLAYGHDLPLFPVSSLAAIAAEAFCDATSASPVLAVIDARMSQLYWAFFTPNVYETGEFVTEPSKILLPRSDIKALYVTGVGFEPYWDQLSLGEDILLSSRVIYPHAKAILKIALSGDIEAIDAGEASPVYLRNTVVTVV